jgi:hypothetical protein
MTARTTEAASSSVCHREGVNRPDTVSILNLYVVSFRSSGRTDTLNVEMSTFANRVEPMNRR